MANKTNELVTAIQLLGKQTSDADEELSEAAGCLATWVQKQVPEGVTLPRGYRVIRVSSSVGTETFLAHGDWINDEHGNYCNGPRELLNAPGGYLHSDFNAPTPECSLDACEALASDVADGWLNELRDWLQARCDKATADAETMREAVR